MEITQQNSTKQEILQHLMKRTQATALELAESLEISPQAIRRHLKDLETEGLIIYKSVQTGMGRPQHIYQLTTQGRDRFPHNYDGFAVSFLDTLAETIGQEQLSQVFHKQWQRKAMHYRQLLGTGKVQERVAHLVELRKAEGFMAEWYPVESQEVDNQPLKIQNSEVKSDSVSSAEIGEPQLPVESYIFMEHNCAISSVAESFPSVCGHELEMFGAVLPDCTVERTHWIVNGEHRCGYLITRKVNSYIRQQATGNRQQATGNRE
ncbi:iron-sulfur cluster biosynthesis transcriptional regulator SufR [Okeania sp. SIO2B3]|uniref:iron-sulfur cluster biosynthesis transcriptional regulator SufR n=1 Tax=Okeania sp. SIO2B3 TaxID=2607784 RepID=UPI0013BEEAC4|nr:iron-sulfur cluster biosynthesis transcriptional regulator SufR [Okeania sp. SIO2B3]NET43777.1 iron-sulfur cluster biosynthesis transcriptional regulator SufR [Okeania sp. SIO2B3]